MAPPPEYDKEPKAPDKCPDSYPSEDSKVLNNQLNDHQVNPDVKVSNSATSSDIEKDVESLDELNLKALLDEAIQYKCPKDREGKSSLFKELLEEAEQDDGSEADALLTLSRAGRPGMPHSNSLQDLVAALAEPARRARPHPPVSARALHGGSLPSGVDTSFLMGEEPRGKEYVATVRCVNPSPLGERRVSASDAHPPDNELLNRRSKAMFPMTYTARATLEIGTRALTTTTASNHQVRPYQNPRQSYQNPKTQPPIIAQNQKSYKHGYKKNSPDNNLTETIECKKGQVKEMEIKNNKQRKVTKAINGVNARNDKSKINKSELYNIEEKYKVIEYRNLNNSLENILDSNQKKLMSALRLNTTCHEENEGGGGSVNTQKKKEYLEDARKLIFNKARASVENVRKPVKQTPNFNNDKTAIYSFNQNKPNLVDTVDSKKIQIQRKVDVVESITNKPNKCISSSIISLEKKGIESAVNVPKLYEIKPSIYRQKQNKAQSMNRCNQTQAQGEEVRINTPNKYIDSSIVSLERQNMQSSVNIPNINENKISVYSQKQNKANSIDIARSLDRCNHTRKHGEEINSVKTKINEPNQCVGSSNSNIPKVNENKVVIQNQKQKDQLLSNIQNLHTFKNGQELEDPNHEKETSINRFYQNIDKLSKKSIFKDKYRKNENINDALAWNRRVDSWYNNFDAYSYNKNLSVINKSEISYNINKCQKSRIKNIDVEPKIVNIPKNVRDKVSNYIPDIDYDEPMLPIISSNHMLRYNPIFKEKNVIHTKETPNKVNFNTKQQPFFKTKRIAIDQNLVVPKIIDVNPANVRRMTIGKSLPIFYTPKEEEARSNTEVIKQQDTGKTDLKITHNGSKNTTINESVLSCSNTVCEIIWEEFTNPFVISYKDDNTEKDIEMIEFEPACNSSLCGEENNNNDVGDLMACGPLNVIKTIRTHPEEPVEDKADLMKLEQSNNEIDDGKSNKVDSTIPFNCITSPEVVTGCTTTPSTSQSAVAVDAKAVVRAAPAATDEYKKSLDENGNAVQGFGSPLSGSGQQKKPRRKKSSKNETVIKSHQIDGYQGNKDLNEVLRFIESNAESGRSKPPRAKHRDDEDKGGKKRSSERRKDKLSGSKPRASSLDAPAARARTPPAAAERRSWGSARQAYCLTEPDSPPPTAPELADFQTVTKKRRARRRPSPPPAPEPRSDSNDDLDSVHSLPAPPPAPTSYADIARTRHNIPDLIESCNYYTEAAPGLEDYPALDARKHKGGGKKEAAAPDVVGQRRPAVVLQGAARHELDGVTFGFDVNEQLLGACDLLLPARGLLRYVPPPPPPLPAPHLQHIVHYVATAWEDVVRCGGGKVHYFGE